MAGETILIVDDTEDNREFVVKYVLEPAGYQTLTAKDGAEGLQMALQSKPDLILLDLNMPRLDGRAVLQKLYESNSDIPVIFMTAHGSEDIAAEMLRLGIRDYVRKPFYPEEMLALVEKNLEELRLRREKEALTERVLLANRELQKRINELNVLYSVGKSVTALMEMDQLLPRLVDAAVQLTRSEEGVLLLHTDGHLICRAQKRHSQSRAASLNSEISDPVAQRVASTGQPILLAPDKAEKLLKAPVSAAYAPLMIKDEVIGVLGVRNVSSSTTVFSSHDAALLSALTDYAAIALENARNYQALRQKTEADNARIRDTFERLVPPRIVDQAYAEPDSIKPGGTRREITVLFADIRGYSTWSENAPPEQVIETLNHYLSLAAEVILSWEGTLDKFLGDGLMAIFNAPDAQQDHVHRAADAALALIKAADEVNLLHGHRLSYSVGLHVGEAVVGYVGTERAVNYTAIGDTVNLAKRLQEYAAPGQILAEEAVIKRLGKLVTARPLGELKVKGRSRPAFAYELNNLADY